MEYTNRYKLPQYLVDWLKNDDYDYNTDPFTISTTTLMKPVKAYWLTLRYGDDLVMDVTDLVASRLGSAIHDSIEQVATRNVSKEERVSKEIEIDGTKFTISGKYDVLTKENEKWIIRDIKTTSVWSFIYGGKDEDYRKQLSVYRWLLTQQHEIEPVAYIDFIFNDWQAVKAKTDDNYPDQRIKAGYKIDLWSLEETEKYVRSRVEHFFKFKDVADEALPICSKEELWASEDTFAVTKPDAKRATKICSSQEDAKKYIEDNKLKTAFIEFRQGKAKRCKYCSAAPFCQQFKNLSQTGLVDTF